MVTREKIFEEIEKIPDEHLEELYRMIKALEVNGSDADSAEGVMARLRKIKISASPDLSIKANSRKKEMLVNPTWEQIVERDPIIAFSLYLSGRISVLLSIADEIIDHLDESFAGLIIDGDRVARAESLMWLWTLGAYEVVRTMCQAKDCFSERAVGEFSKLKKTLSTVRMPAAKMEKPGKKIPVTSNRSPSGWDAANRDLLVGDPESTTDMSARFILIEFDRVMSSIEKNDVLARHEQSYAGGPNSAHAP